LYNPIFKRGKAKKFSYKYEGPYEVEMKISPLVYKIRVDEEKSVIVHINRLKRAYRDNKINKGEKQTKLDGKSRVSATQEEVVRNKQVTIPDSKRVQVEDSELRSPRVRDSDDYSWVESPNSECGDKEIQDWVPDTRYLRRKLYTETDTSARTTTPGIPYQLRPRVGRRQEEGLSENVGDSSPSNQPEVSEEITETRPTTDAEVVQTPNKQTVPHSYNLRSRTQST
jgi:hypothetical protein